MFDFIDEIWDPEQTDLGSILNHFCRFITHMCSILVFSLRFKMNDCLNHCQARLLLFSAQSSKFNSQKINSEKRSRADVTIQMHQSPTYNFLKLVEWWLSLSISSQTKWVIFWWRFEKKIGTNFNYWFFILDS